MHSFTLLAIGNLARDPEHMARAGGNYTRLCLVGNDAAGKDPKGNPCEMVTSVSLVAFGTLAEILASHARKGDQLIVQAQMRSSTWTDKDGARQHDHSFVIQQFRFGAPGRLSREAFAARDAQALVTPF